MRTEARVAHELRGGGGDARLDHGEGPPEHAPADRASKDRRHVDEDALARREQSTLAVAIHVEPETLGASGKHLPVTPLNPFAGLLPKQQQETWQGGWFETPFGVPRDEGQPSGPWIPFRVEIETGRRELWKVITPSDTTGLSEIYAIQISDDGESYYYTFSRKYSDLFLVGLR